MIENRVAKSTAEEGIMNLILTVFNINDHMFDVMSELSHTLNNHCEFPT
jgi:hypothetical protein